ncbi:aspartate/glutamate racemase family protein [Halanaeroarchaeum sulfurireducens]|uniref:Aspartate racemase n=1 Tax=Halanaeroarchaeum sulfurireducens TaxID=1604004 RepID=A0A0F7PFV6_9EURY|nr:amino acid racemase [Halanaeroarchaeum sulfurireducens]AKH98163.1 aspartate racemase [Halanaeroarchaeum sulfurireducens]ALG82557.1 aspartate racemase [Halanaeroarchaeum sulfurireducens]
MERIGILGGMAPESTLEYYRIIVEESHERGWGKRYPQTFINSLNFETFYEPLSAGNDERVVEVLTDGVQSLARAGADFALMASNTPHRYFQAVDAATSIPLVNIVDVTADAAVKRDVQRVGLLGTAFTMEGEFYPAGFRERGLEVVTPSPADREWIDETIFEELTDGVFTDEIEAGLRDIIEKLATEEGVDAVALACTELPLVVDDADVPVPTLNTTRLHAEAAFERAATGDFAQ